MNEHKVISKGTPEKIFRQTDNLKTASLKKPLILELYQEIKRRGLANASYCPRGVPDLVHSLRKQDLVWVNIPPEIIEGDYIILGILYGEYALDSAYEAANYKVLHIHENGLAIAQMDRKVFRAGSIEIYDVDSYSTEDIFQIIKSHGIECVGAMGKKSKLVAERDNIYLEVTTSVIDRCILNALAGQRCLILANGGMVYHALKRIKDYMKKSGLNIPVNLVNQKAEMTAEQNVTERLMT
jgi:cobalt/nickel transport system ATP-binding protein